MRCEASGEVIEYWRDPLAFTQLASEKRRYRQSYLFHYYIGGVCLLLTSFLPSDENKIFSGTRVHPLAKNDMTGLKGLSPAFEKSVVGVNTSLLKGEYAN